MRDRIQGIQRELGKIPPHDESLEKTILGTIINDVSHLHTHVLEMINSLDANDFYKIAHSTIFTVIKDMSVKGMPINLLSVTQEIRRQGKGEESGGVVYIASITNEVYYIADECVNGMHLLMNYSMCRRLCISLYELAGKLYDPSYDIHDATGELERINLSVLNRLTTSDEKKLREVVVDVMNDISQRASGNDRSGVETHIKSVDNIVRQFGNSDLIVIGARPAMGKTSFILSAALNMAKSGVPVAVFSLEMSSTQLGARIVSQETGVDVEDVMKRVLDETRMIHINKNLSGLDGLPMYFDDEAGLSIESFRVKAKRMHKMYGIRAIFIDYLQLMTVKSMGKTFNREQEISTISRGLKIVAKELNVPVIVLSQLSREVEKRSDKRPILSDLRESGAIEQDADMVGFLYRPEYYGIQEDSSGNSLAGVCELIISKNRNGSLGIAKMSFIPHLTKCGDIDMGTFPSSKPITAKNTSFLPNEDLPF